MNRTIRSAIMLPLFAFTPFVLGTSPAFAQSDSILGTYELVAVDNVAPTGARIHLYGPNPQGILTFYGNGRYALQIARVGEAAFSVNDKSKGTKAEYKTAAMDTNTHFGTYTVDAIKHTITFRIEEASFPNWDGTTQVRNFALKGEILTYEIPAPTSGAHVIGQDIWKRIS